MEYLLIIVIVAAFSLLDDRIRGKKKVPPPTVPREIPQPEKQQRAQGGTFEIPPMRNVPQASRPDAEAALRTQEELRAKWEEQRRAAEQKKRQQRRQEELRAAAVQTAPAHQPLRRRPMRALLPQLTPAAMQQAVVLSEILGRPRAMRRFPRR